MIFPYLGIGAAIVIYAYAKAHLRCRLWWMRTWELRHA